MSQNENIIICAFRFIKIRFIKNIGRFVCQKGVNNGISYAVSPLIYLCAKVAMASAMATATATATKTKKIARNVAMIFFVECTKYDDSASQ